MPRTHVGYTVISSGPRVSVRYVECDQVIFSDGLTSGRVSSPYYPSYYPLNVRCTYYIDGLQDKQNLEKVNLTITELDIPHTGPGSAACLVRIHSMFNVQIVRRC